MGNPTEERQPLPISNKKLWEMAMLITNNIKAAYKKDTNKAIDVYWAQLEGEYFDWLEEQLFGEQP